MTEDDFDDISCTVGNLVRISFLLEPEEVRAVCAAARVAAADTLLLDPRESPRTPDEQLLNCKLLQAFERFRMELEDIRRERQSNSPTLA